MLDPSIGPVISTVIVSGAFTVMGRSHSKQIKSMLAEFAEERRTLVNHALSGTAFEFAARQRASEAPAKSVSAPTVVHQFDI